MHLLQTSYPDDQNIHRGHHYMPVYSLHNENEDHDKINHQIGLE